MDKLLDSLNDSQREAVVYSDGPSLVIAGAGSGKTRVLTYKIAYLLQQGYEPWSILALTFTNKAAREMKERIGTLVGADRARYLNMGTFHSVFAHILRREAEAIGFQPNFTIYDNKDSQSLVKAIVKEMKLDDKQYAPATIFSAISRAKNRLILPKQYADDIELRDRDRFAKVDQTYQIYAAYQDRLRQANAMDFDDLLIHTYLLFKNNGDICRRYADRFRYVLVDEYQDTNSVQQQIVLLLTSENQKICVVGDDYQSIYAFRGAQIDNILNFQRIYKDVHIFKLERNYRSTPEIVNAANSLMKHNQYQIDKDVFSSNDNGDKVTYRQLYSDREEAAVVAKTIRSIMRDEGCDYRDFAILYRTNSQSRIFEEEFRNDNMPYRVVGSTEFFQRKEIKDVIAYYRVVVNPADEEAVKRIINYPTRGIGNTTLQKIISCAQSCGVSLWTVLGNPFAYQLDINRGTMAKLGAFVQLIEGFMEHLADKDAYELGDMIVRQSGVFDDLYRSTDIESRSRQENLGELLGSINEFVESRKEEGQDDRVSLPDFLQQVSLQTDADTDDNDDDRISLMTIHAAKGLEFATVFVVGLEEKLFPSLRSSNSLKELEEERRLLYVAITRARKHCYLSSAKNRWMYSQMEMTTPSRFIRDISSEFLDVVSSSRGDSGGGAAYQGHARSGYGRRDDDSWQNSRPVGGQFVADRKPKITRPHQPETAVDPFSEGFKQRYVARGGNLRRLSSALSNGGRTVAPSGAPQSAPAAPDCALSVGTVIEHQRFGVGRVVQIDGTGENTKATVDFENTGRKQLLLKFARYTIKS